jgi:hypothetical protein
LAITNGYCTLNEVKASLRIPVSDTIDDDLLELAIESASRDIDQATERQFFPTDTHRFFTPRDSLVCEIDDVSSLTSIKSSTAADGTYDTTWSESDYQLEPLNGIAGGMAVPFDTLRAVGDYYWPSSGLEVTVRVEGTFGFATAPIAIKQATVLLASRIFKRNDSPGGVMGFGDIGVVRVSKFDPDIERLINPYRKIRFA